MSKQTKTILVLAAVFLPLSALLYFIHYLIFQDAHHIFIYLLGDLAFMPLEVFLVVVVIERLLTMREKRDLMEKLNMVVGTFFSEVGTNLLGSLLPSMDKHDEISARLNVRPTWGEKEFKEALAYCFSIQGSVDPYGINLDNLKEFLTSKRPFMLTLMENPNLLENEKFTDVLWAAFHLDEELERRSFFDDLPETDVQHIAGDIKRLYGYLLIQWLEHVRHLRGRYPYLYSLVLRTHPFQEHRSAIVTK